MHPSVSFYVKHPEMVFYFEVLMEEFYLKYNGHVAIDDILISWIAYLKVDSLAILFLPIFSNNVLEQSSPKHRVLVLGAGCERCSVWFLLSGAHSLLEVRHKSWWAACPLTQ